MNEALNAIAHPPPNYPGSGSAELQNPFTHTSFSAEDGIRSSCTECNDILKGGPESETSSAEEDPHHYDVAADWQRNIEAHLRQV